MGKLSDWYNDNNFEAIVVAENNLLPIGTRVSILPDSEILCEVKSLPEGYEGGSAKVGDICTLPDSVLSHPLNLAHITNEFILRPSYSLEDFNPTIILSNKHPGRIIISKSLAYHLNLTNGRRVGFFGRIFPHDYEEDYLGIFPKEETHLGFTINNRVLLDNTGSDKLLMEYDRLKQVYGLSVDSTSIVPRSIQLDIYKPRYSQKYPTSIFLKMKKK